MLQWLWLSALVVALDQLSKRAAEALLALHEPLALLPSFNLTLMYNTGAAFSFLAQAGGWQRWFFMILALLISAVLVIWLSRLERGQRWQAAALALIVGGALGNLIDRVLLGHVIDFIDLYHEAFSGWPGFTDDGHWPAFNLADAAITVGAVMLVGEALFDGQRASANSKG